MGQALTGEQLRKQITDLSSSLVAIADKVAETFEKSQIESFDFSTEHSFAEADYASFAAAILKGRAARFAAVPSSFLGEPGYDILLQIFVSDQLNRRETVSSLSYVPGISQTTGLRWIQLLEREGWVTREKDPGDKRLALIRLSEEGATRIKAMIQAQVAATRQALLSSR